MIGTTHQGHEFLDPGARALATMSREDIVEAALIPTHGVYSLHEKSLVAAALGFTREEVLVATIQEAGMPCPFVEHETLRHCFAARGHRGDCVYTLPCDLPRGHDGECRPRPMSLWMHEGEHSYGPHPYAHPSRLWDLVPPGHPSCGGLIEAEPLDG